MRKANKQITLDMDLIVAIDKLQLNVSEYCNEKLWNYVNRVEGVKKEHENTDNLDKQIEDLEKQKQEIEKSEELKKAMKEAGMTEDKLKFLKSMNTNIVVAKDMKLGWLRKFNEEKKWDELLELKRKWV